MYRFVVFFIQGSVLACLALVTFGDTRWVHVGICRSHLEVVSLYLRLLSLACLELVPFKNAESARVLYLSRSESVLARSEVLNWRLLVVFGNALCVLYLSCSEVLNRRVSVAFGNVYW